MNLQTFTRYIGIDYSGAEPPTASLLELRIHEGGPSLPPLEVLPQRAWRRSDSENRGSPPPVEVGDMTDD